MKNSLLHLIFLPYFYHSLYYLYMKQYLGLLYIDFAAFKWKWIKCFFLNPSRRIHGSVKCRKEPHCSSNDITLVSKIVSTKMMALVLLCGFILDLSNINRKKTKDIIFLYKCIIYLWILLLLWLCVGGAAVYLGFSWTSCVFSNVGTVWWAKHWQNTKLETGLPSLITCKNSLSTKLSGWLHHYV